MPARLRSRASLGYCLVDPRDERTGESQAPRASKSAILLMAVIVICLAMVAVFANVQRSRRDSIETVVVRATTSPTPQQR